MQEAKSVTPPTKRVRVKLDFDRPRGIFHPETFGLSRYQSRVDAAWSSNFFVCVFAVRIRVRFCLNEWSWRSMQGGGWFLEMETDRLDFFETLYEVQCYMYFVLFSIVEEKLKSSIGIIEVQ